jgi:thiamine-monophosphate kinase
MRGMSVVLENAMQQRWADLLPRPSAQIGSIHTSDAELIPLGDGRLLVLKIDTMVEEILAGLYVEPFTVGRTTVVSTLSDLAAVGAEPLGLLMSVTLPEGAEQSTQERMALGIRAACEEAGVGVLGGDTSVGRALAASCVAAGVVPAKSVFSRIGAAPGDHIFASGPLGIGGALAATRLLGLPGVFSEEDYRPPVRLAQGIALRGIASACMDTSDGLVATLDQLSRLNDCAIRITAPLASLLHPKVDALRRTAGLPCFPFLASHHGEFELVFTVREARLPDLTKAASAIGWDPLPVGRIESGDGLFVGERLIDGGRIRNLLHETKGDVAAYVRELLSIGVEQP